MNAPTDLLGYLTASSLLAANVGVAFAARWPGLSGRSRDGAGKTGGRGETSGAAHLGLPRCVSAMPTSIS